MSQQEKRKRGRPRKLDPIRADDTRSVNLNNNDNNNNVHSVFEFDNSAAHDLEAGVTLSAVDGVIHEDMLTNEVYNSIMDDGIAVDGDMHVESSHDEYASQHNELSRAGLDSREADQMPHSLGPDRQGVISETVIDSVVEKVLKKLAERGSHSGQQLHSAKVVEAGQNSAINYSPLSGMRNSVVENMSQRGQASSIIYQRKRDFQTARPLRMEPQTPQLDLQNSEQELATAKRVIAEVMAMHAAVPFNRPVDPIALGIPDYLEIVETPMDFSTIYINLEKGVKYRNSEDVFKDVGHIWRSCRQYYSKGDQIMDLMELVEKNFMNLWTTARLRKGYAGIFSSVVEAKQQVNKGVKPITKNKVQRQQDDVTDSVPKKSKYPTVDQLQQDERHIILDTDELRSSPHDQNEVEQSQPQPQQTDSDYYQAYHPGSTSEQECPSEPLAIKDISCPDSSIDPFSGGSNQVHNSHLVILEDRLTNQLEGSAGEIENYAPDHIHTTDMQPYHLPCDGDAGSSDFSSKKRKTRGPTKCLYVWNRHEDKRIYIPINKLGEPIGSKASKLSNFLGTIARDGRLVPLGYLTWKKVPAEIQENIWQLVQSKFDIDPQVRGWVFRNLATKFANWKAHLKSKHYNPHQTDEERLADCDKRVLPDQWQQLITFWNSEESQKQSERNKANRAKVKFCHTSGTKSFARLSEEQAKTRGKEPTKAELFILTRTRKDGQPVNELSSMAIAQLQERMAQLPEIIENDDIIDEILYETIGQTRRNRTRITSRAEAMTMASEIERAADEEVSQMRQKMEQMEQKYNHMESLMNKVLSNMETNSANEQAPRSLALATEDTTLSGSPIDQVPA